MLLINKNNTLVISIMFDIQCTCWKYEQYIITNKTRNNIKFIPDIFEGELFN